jgi:hypothetical protein
MLHDDNKVPPRLRSQAGGVAPEPRLEHASTVPP